MARTLTVKNQLEVELSYSFTDWIVVGELVITGSGAGTYTADTAIFAGGTPIYARVKENAVGSAAVVLTVTGTGTSGTVTLDARSQEGSGVVITDSYAAIETYTDVTSVTFTGGAAGEKVELISIPPASYWDNALGGTIGYDTGFTYDEGTTSRAIANKYEVADHWKRARGETSININKLYQAFTAGLTWVRDRNILLKVEIKDDGGSTATETYYFNKTRIQSAPVDFSDNSDGAVSGTGMYNTLMCIA